MTRSTAALSVDFAAPELFGLCTLCGMPDNRDCHDHQDGKKIRKTKETDVYAFGCLYYAVSFGFILLTLFMTLSNDPHRHSLILICFLGKATFKSCESLRKEDALNDWKSRKWKTAHGNSSRGVGDLFLLTVRRRKKL